MITTECRLLFLRHAERRGGLKIKLAQEMIPLEQVREIRNGLGGLGLEVELIDGRILRVTAQFESCNFNC